MGLALLALVSLGLKKPLVISFFFFIIFRAVLYAVERNYGADHFFDFVESHANMPQNAAIFQVRKMEVQKSDAKKI